MRRSSGGTRKKAKVNGVKRRRTSHRRRRISGMGDIGGIVEKAGGLVVGAVAARELNTLLSGFVTLSPMVSGLLQMGVGVMLPKFAKGSFMQNVGDGMIANGGMVVIVSTKLISGASDRAAYVINGTANLPVVNGTANLPVVNGTRIANNSKPQQTVYVKPQGRFNPYV
jgi:hypothetical protein